MGGSVAKARKRSVGSLASELVQKSRDSALCAIRVFNDPYVSFKSETFIVLMVIAWTYLLHAYYRKKKIEYRYFEQRAKRKVFDRTKHGAYKVTGNYGVSLSLEINGDEVISVFNKSSIFCQRVSGVMTRWQPYSSFAAAMIC